MSDPTGRDILMQLVSEADVFIQNFRPGGRTFKIAYPICHVNPDLIYLSVSGFGADGLHVDHLCTPIIQAIQEWQKPKRPYVPWWPTNKLLCWRERNTRALVAIDERRTTH